MLERVFGLVEVVWANNIESRLQRTGKEWVAMELD